MKRNEIEALLPSVFQRTLHPGNPLVTLLQIMDDLHAPAEEILDDLASFFNPYQTPDEFVPYLANWVDLARLLTETPATPGAAGAPELPTYAAGLGRLRELIAAAADLSQWRGTRQGLVRFLETATGLSGFVVNEQVLDTEGRVRPFHMRVHAPMAAQPYAALVQRIVELEKPAYMTTEVLFDAFDAADAPPSGVPSA